MSEILGGVLMVGGFLTLTAWICYLEEREKKQRERLLETFERYCGDLVEEGRQAVLEEQRSANKMILEAREQIKKEVLAEHDLSGCRKERIATARKWGRHVAKG